MKATLDEMWCSPITCDAKLVAEIQSQVDSECDARLRLREVTSLFPGFVDELVKYATATQEEIDDAWLAAATDLLGRPAIKHHEILFDDMEDPFESIQQEGERMSNMLSDTEEADRQTFEPSRPARVILPYELRNLDRQTFYRRPSIRRWSTLDDDMFYTDMEEPFEPSWHDIQSADSQETQQQRAIRRPAIHMLSTYMEDQFEPIQHHGQRVSNFLTDQEEAIQQANYGP